MGVDYQAMVVFGVVLPAGHRERLRKLAGVKNDQEWFDEDAALSRLFPGVSYYKADSAYSSDEGDLVLCARSVDEPTLSFEGDYAHKLKLKPPPDKEVQALVEAAKKMGARKPVPGWVLVGSVF